MRNLGLVIYIWESLAKMVFKTRRLDGIIKGTDIDRKEEQVPSPESPQCLMIRNSATETEGVAIETGGNQGSVLSRNQGENHITEEGRISSIKCCQWVTTTGKCPGHW